LEKFSEKCVTNIKIFSGSSNVQLARAIAESLGTKLGNVIIDHFNDGEIMLEVKESVRGKDVFIIQSTSFPSNDNLMELVLLADALRRSSAANITAIIPYFGYARQDRREKSARVPVTARVVADMLATVGINRCVTVDLHTEQMQGFFSMPLDNIYASQIILNDIRRRNENFMIVSPDIGGVARAKEIANKLNVAMAIVDKRRIDNKVEIANVIGDVAGKNCIVIDDIIDTGSTLLGAVTSLKQQGALSVSAYCTHAILSNNSAAKVAESELKELVVTDSILRDKKNINIIKLRVLSLGDIIAETINRLTTKGSISEMFN
jgi:ribose-phosphate pyrophosphokinase